MGAEYLGFFGHRKFGTLTYQIVNFIKVNQISPMR